MKTIRLDCGIHVPGDSEVARKRSGSGGRDRKGCTHERYHFPYRNARNIVRCRDCGVETAVQAHLSPLGKRSPGRNSPCPCGSGKKFKKCCLNGVSVNG